jgi:hypothetical protein
MGMAWWISIMVLPAHGQTPELEAGRIIVLKETRRSESSPPVSGPIPGFILYTGTVRSDYSQVQGKIRLATAGPEKPQIPDGLKLRPLPPPKTLAPEVLRSAGLHSAGDAPTAGGLLLTGFSVTPFAGLERPPTNTPSVLPETVKTAPAMTDTAVPSRQGLQVSPSQRQEVPAVRQFSGSRPEQHPPRPAPAAVQQRTGGPAHDTSSGGEGIFRLVLIHFVSYLAALLVGLGLFAAVLLVFLRRAGVALHPVAPAEAGAVQGSSEVTPLPLAAPESISLPERVNSESPDLGPSYAEELQRKQEETRQQEEAMLRHLFEQNLRLREEIAGLRIADVESERQASVLDGPCS